jgi:hypothetical protein
LIIGPSIGGLEAAAWRVEENPVAETVKATSAKTPTTKETNLKRTESSRDDNEANLDQHQFRPRT